MSAYTNGRGSQIIAFSGGAGNANPEAFEHVPVLPQIGNELEHYFSAARQIEAALIQERSHLKKAKEELKDLQVKYSRLSFETENKLRDQVTKEERLSAQVLVLHQNEKNLRGQIDELLKNISNLQEEKKKIEFNSDLLKTNLDYLKKREGSVNELEATRNELQRYKNAWASVVAMERKAKVAIQEAETAKKIIDQLNEAFGKEKVRASHLEDSLNKEKREKQIALSCLHSTEDQLVRVNRVLEDARRQPEKELDFSHQGIQLKF